MTFDELATIATTVVESTRRRLPAAIREAALIVPVSFEPSPSKELVDDGLDADILGLFVGQDHTGGIGDTEMLPSQIVLFLENLWDFSGADQTVYRDEVRLTYLHELGHYFGWTEAEIEQRGLE